MSSEPKTLYHYCSTQSFLSIMNSNAIWLSDVGKSNDRKEMQILRRHFYDYIYRKYQTTKDKTEKECCKLLLAVAKTDGFDGEIDLLNRMDLAQKLIDIYKGLRAYCFCLTELKDSLGQWRGYADNGNGICIGFSKTYLDNIKSESFYCPVFNFQMLSIAYESKNMDKFCEIIYNSCPKEHPAKFITQAFEKLFHISVFFKDKSFKEEKEWRIAFAFNDSVSSVGLLNFKHFAKISNEKYNNHFATPTMQFTATPNDIISHIEVGILDMTSAINHIIIGPKSNLTENDIKQLLISKGLLKNMSDKSIKISKSSSSYR